MKQAKVYRSKVIVLVFVLVLLLFSSSGVEVSGSEEARLGSALGEVLLNWKLMVLNGPAYAEGSGLGSSLTALEARLKGFDSPASLADRVPPLQSKLERATREDVWGFQFGFWNFAQDDDTVSLSGARMGEDILVDKSEGEGTESGKLGFRYLNFPDRGDTAKISVSERLGTPLSDSFTVEFWLRVSEPTEGIVIGSGDWSLNLADGELILTKSDGDEIVEVETNLLNNWSHVSLTWNGELIRLYLNGNKVIEEVYSGSVIVSDELTIGGGLIGSVDELRIKKDEVESDFLNFDQPIDYLLGFPILDWAQSNFSPDELWEVYAGLLISNISLKRESGQYSVSGANVKQVASFLLEANRANVEIPQNLPPDVKSAIETLGSLGEDGEISGAEVKDLERALTEISSHLGLS